MINKIIKQIKEITGVRTAFQVDERIVVEPEVCITCGKVLKYDSKHELYACFDANCMTGRTDL